MFFFCLLGLIIGIISSICSYFILLSSIPFFAYLIWNRKKKESILLLVCIVLGVILILLNLKGRVGGISTMGVVIKSSNNYFVIKTLNGNYYVDNEGYMPLFSIITINGLSKELSFFTYEGSFDFKGYLNNRNVFYEIEVKSMEVNFKMYPIIHNYKNYVLSFLNEENKKIIGQFLFSKGASNLKDYQLIYNSGHIILISSIGIHISFLQRLIERILDKFHIKRKNVILIGINLLFFFLSSFKLSLFRLLLKRTLVAYKSRFKLNKTFDVYLLTFIILLILMPRMICDNSIYIPLVLCLFNGLTNFYFEHLGKIKRKAFKILFNFLFFLPIYLMSTNNLNLFSSLLNTLFIYPSFFIFILSMILLFVPIIGIVLNPIVTLHLNILSFISNIGSIYFGEQFLFVTIFYYVIFTLFFVFKFYGLKKISSLSLYCLPMLIFIQPLDSFIPKYEIYFLNVGQGDSTLLRYDSFNILFDTGGLKNVDLATESLIPFFKKKRIRQLDAIFITHDDYDHIGALEGLVKRFKVCQVFYNYNLGSETYIGDLKISNLNLYKSGRKSNENSSVFYFEVKKKKIMIMGDATIENEKDIMRNYKDLKADVLKVGHHGSKTSSSFEFLKYISPKLAIISVGASNFYGHPHKDVISNLDNLNIQYLRTDEKGTIKYML